MERKIKAYAAHKPGGKLEPFEFNPGELRPEQVEIKVSHCGICHSDLSMRDNEWQMTTYPFVPGHEAVGEIVATGDQVKNLKIGLKAIAGKFDLIISTVNADLNWPAFLYTLAPKGRLHFVGVVPRPISLFSFPLIAGQRSVSGSPVGSPAVIANMLEFCARHDIAPVTERFKMSEVNEAFEYLAAGRARYRIVLESI